MATFLICAGVIVVVCGVANLAWMLRESRVGTHPTCRKCGYDLRGIWKRIVQCPECGGDVRIVSRGHWQFEWRMIVGPVLLLLLGLGLGGVALAPKIYQSVAVSTTSALLAQTLNFDRKKAAQAYLDLQLLREEGRLSSTDEVIYQARRKDRAKVDRLVRTLPPSARTLGEARTALIIWTQLVRLGVDAPKPVVDEQYVSASEIEKIVKDLQADSDAEFWFMPEPENKAKTSQPSTEVDFKFVPQDKPASKAPPMPDSKPSGRFDPY